MVFWCHLIYALVFVIFFIHIFIVCPQTKEEQDMLKRDKRNYIKRIPYIFMVLIYIFPIMDSVIRADSPEAFYQRFINEFITASFANSVIFLNCTKFGKERCENILTLPYIAFFLYTLVRNIVIHKDLFWIILAEIAAIATMIVFWILFGSALPYNIFPPTKAEKEKLDAEAAADEEQKRIKEEEKRIQEEQKRIREEESARIHETYERVVLGKKTGSSNYSSSGSKDFVTDYLNEKGQVSSAKYDKSCSNCSYFDGSECICGGSDNAGKRIYSPEYSSCGWHNRYR